MKEKKVNKTTQSFDRLEGRKAVLKAIAALRRVRNRMKSDPRCCLKLKVFSYALDRFAETIDHVLPEHESLAILPWMRTEVE